MADPKNSTMYESADMSISELVERQQHEWFGKPNVDLSPVKATKALDDEGSFLDESNVLTESVVGQSKDRDLKPRRSARELKPSGHYAPDADDSLLNVTDPFAASASVWVGGDGENEQPGDHSFEDSCEHVDETVFKRALHGRKAFTELQDYLKSNVSRFVNAYFISFVSVILLLD